MRTSVASGVAITSSVLSLSSFTAFCGVGLCLRCFLGGRVVSVCVYPDCHSKPNRGHVMCLAHWRSLPRDLQAAAQERIHGWHNLGAAREYLALSLRRIAKGARYDG